MGSQISKHDTKDKGTAGNMRQDASPTIYKKNNQVVVHAPKISNTPSFFSAKTYGSCTSYDALSQRNYIGINPHGRLAIEPTTRKDVETPSSQLYEVYLQSFKQLTMNEDEFSNLHQRVHDNTDKMQRKIHEDRVHAAKLKRQEEQSRLITEREFEKRTPSVYSYLSIKERLISMKASDKKYFPTEKFPELTLEMMAVINDSSKPYPAEEALVELDGVQILRKDIQTLLGLNWLNDEIMNAYMNLLVLRGKGFRRKTVYAFNTFFYPKLRSSGYNSIKRWTRKVDIFNHDFVLVPVHLGNHWCLALIDFTNRTISYFDSMGGGQNGCCNTLLEYLRQESLDKKKQDFGKEDWNLIDRSYDIPRQTNCSDCGVFACTYAEYLTRPAKFNFTQENMPYFRKKMIYEIITKQIL
ncbi:hypothetical protein SUGI_1515260 [Cryptomeria japonica]|uniref:Ubiquitin-like protease family profile domain-containing protein n=1 Tax=Cryptomeria japonica TaxID=3369 RepID=A0AAD3NTS4_CRYJA|nr:hypothetical protein SUGI_1515260 [Cryptomeria japonica]